MAIRADEHHDAARRTDDELAPSPYSARVLGIERLEGHQARRADANRLRDEATTMRPAADGNDE